jgi:hypothetical protein
LGFVRGSIITGNVNAQWRDDADKFFKKLTEKIIPNRNIVAHTGFRANDKGNRIPTRPEQDASIPTKQ